MADFVPKNQFDPNAPNWTGASRGPDRHAYTADRSFETLFSGLGEAVTGAANAAYTGIVENIKTDWRKEFEPVRDAQGVGDTTDAATVGLRHPAGSPPQMESFESRAQKLTEAHREGRIGDGYYYAQLNAMSKEMRSKYPGFRDEVDAVIQKTTGVVPANALRNAVLAQLEAGRSAEEKAAKDAQAYALKNEQHWTPQMRERVASGGALPTIQELSPIVSANEGRKRMVQAVRGELELEESQGKAVAGKAEDAARNEVWGLYGQTFGPAMASLDGKIQSTLTSGKPPTAQEMAAIEQEVQRLEMTFQSGVDRVINGVPEGGTKSLASMIRDADKVRKLREEALAPFMRIKEAIANKDFGLAQANARFLARQADAKGRELITRYDSLGTLAGLATTEGGKAFVAQLNVIPGGAAIQSQILKDVRDSFHMSHAAGKTTLADEVKEGKVQGAGAAYWRSRLDDIQRVLADPNTSPEIRANYAKAVFSSEIPFKEKAQAFRQLASPAVSQQMVAIKETQPEVFKQYQDWMMKSFFQVHKQLGDDVNAATEQKHLAVKFNPQTNQFEIGVTQEGMNVIKPRLRGALTDPLEAIARTQPGARGVVDAVNEMNRNIKVLEPIMKATGMDVGAEMQNLLKIQKVQPDAPKKKGWLDMIDEGLRAGVKAVGSAAAGALDDTPERKAMRDKITTQFGGAELDFPQASGGNQGTGSQASLNASEITNKKGADLDNLAPRTQKFLEDLANEGIIEAIDVKSGYRDPERNARARGAKGSKHMDGLAVDIDVRGLSDEQKAAILDAAIAKGARGVGIYPGGNSIHLDLRDKPATWGFSPFGAYRGAEIHEQPAWSHGPLRKLFGKS